MPYLAPDATALGQIYWYTVETSPEHPIDSGRLWALNKFYIAPQLNSAPGVADVAVVGGTPLEYQIDVRPEDLRAYGITIGELFAAVGKSNMPAGGGVVQKNNAEYIVRGVGWIKDKYDIEDTRHQGNQRHADLCQDDRHRAARDAISPQRLRKGRQRGNRRSRAHAARREPAGRDRARQAEDSRVATRLARGRPYRRRVRPHAPDSRRDPHADRSHVARDADRVAGDPADSHARAQRVRDLRHAAAVGAVFVPDDVAAAPATRSSTSKPTSCRWPESRSRSASWSTRRS